MMPKFHIYKQGQKIATKEFNYHFFIVKSLNGEISWTADREKGGDEILLWVQSDYSVSAVRPDWQLIIDNIPLPQKLYEFIELEGRNVCFRYNEYDFVCQFPRTNN